MNTYTNPVGCRRFVSPLLILGCIASASLVTSPVAAAAKKPKRHPGYVDGSQFAELAEEDGLLVEVSLAGPLLKMVTSAIGGQSEDAAELLGDIVSIHAVVVGVEESEDRDLGRIINAFDEELRDDGWQRLARVREENNHVLVLALPGEDDALSGLTVVVRDSDEDVLVFANIAGSIHLDMIAQLGMQLDIPGLEELSEAAAKAGAIKKRSKTGKSKKR
ncbi:MAG: DUF4252 domain-containing protein [Phycisphaerae bacterium]